jgi:nucleoside 2-deoxyribosyltransferase
MQIYFAAPLFSEAELEFNRRLAAELEERGHDVFLPQRDGIEIAEVYDQPDVGDIYDLMDEVFRIDRDAVYEADLLTAVLDGQVPDEGVALEMGLAYENDVPIVAMKTDTRSFSPDEPVNAMLWGAADEFVETTDALLAAVDDRA